jgi:hypothetical protein
VEYAYQDISLSQNKHLAWYLGVVVYTWVLKTTVVLGAIVLAW